MASTIRQVLSTTCSLASSCPLGLLTACRRLGGGFVSLAGGRTLLSRGMESRHLWFDTLCFNCCLCVFGSDPAAESRCNRGCYGTGTKTSSREELPSLRAAAMAGLCEAALAQHAPLSDHRGAPASISRVVRAITVITRARCHEAVNSSSITGLHLLYPIKSLHATHAIRLYTSFEKSRSSPRAVDLFTEQSPIGFAERKGRIRTLLVVFRAPL
jgi:hypothetical protein